MLATMTIAMNLREAFPNKTPIAVRLSDSAIILFIFFTIDSELNNGLP